MKPLLISVLGMAVGTGCVTLPTGVHPWANKTPQADNVKPASEKPAPKPQKVNADNINPDTAFKNLRNIETELKADEID